MSSLDATMNTIKPILRMVGRAARATGVVVILGALGGFVGCWLANSGLPTPDWAKTVVTTGFLLATMEKAITQALVLGRWIRSGVGDGLATFSTFFFVTFVTGVTAALVLVDEINKPERTPSPVVAQVVPRQLAPPPVVFVNIPAANVAAPSPDGNVFLVPFYKEAGGCTTTDPWFGKGAKLSDSTKRFIQKLAQGFLQCARPDHPVVLELRGFASSQPFLRCKGKETSLNLEIANKRAEAVKQAFEEAFEEIVAARPNESTGEVKVTVLPWARIEEMEAERRWNDRDERSDEYSKTRAILTRRAEITVKSTGGCERSPLPEQARPQTASGGDSGTLS